MAQQNSPQPPPDKPDKVKELVEISVYLAEEAANLTASGKSDEAARLMAQAQEFALAADKEAAKQAARAK